MKLIAVIFHNNVRIFGNELLSNVDLENGMGHKERFKIALNKDLRMVRIDILKGVGAGKTVYIPLEQVQSLRAEA